MSYLSALNQNPLLQRRRPMLVPTSDIGSGAGAQTDVTAAAPYGGSVETPSSVAMKRRLALALLQSGTSTEPVGHWTGALARALRGGVGGYYMGKANEEEAAGRRASMMRLARALNAGRDGRMSGEATAALLTDPWVEGAGGGRRLAANPSTSATERIVQRLMEENPELSFEDAVGRVRRAPRDDTISRERLAVQALREGAFDTLEDARSAYGLEAMPQGNLPSPAGETPATPAPVIERRPATIGGGLIGADQHQEVLLQAQQAIANGAPREAVIERLRGFGIDVPPGL